MAERAAWMGTGNLQDAAGRTDRLDAEAAYAVKAGVHLWTAVVVHKLGDSALDTYEAVESDDPSKGALILDVESLLNRPMVGCFVCGDLYEPRLRRRKCPGDPNGLLEPRGLSR